MPGSKRGRDGTNLLKIAEWIFYYFFLSAQSKLEIWGKFKTNTVHLRDFYAFHLILQNVRDCTQAYNSIPFPVALSLQASLISFILLGIMPMHWLAIPTSIGGGLAVAIIINVFKI